jgi:hypothetical protein
MSQRTQELKQFQNVSKCENPRSSNLNIMTLWYGNSSAVFLIWKWGIEGLPYGVLNEHSGLLDGMSTFLSKRKCGLPSEYWYPNRTLCSGIKRNPKHHAIQVYCYLMSPMQPLERPYVMLQTKAFQNIDSSSYFPWQCSHSQVTESSYFVRLQLSCSNYDPWSQRVWVCPQADIWKYFWRR